MLRSDIARRYPQSAKEYTNALLNGSFENDFASWYQPASIPVVSTADKKEGNKSLYWNTGAASWAGTYQSCGFTVNHKVYIAMWINILTITGGLFLASGQDGLNNTVGYLEHYATTNGWILKSGLYTLSNAGLKVNVGTSSFIGTMYVDAVAAIDLTTKFGTGSEPTKIWCDANITIDKIDWRLS